MSRRKPGVPVLALLGVACWAVACGDGTTEPPPAPPRPDPPRATTVTVTPATARLVALGDTLRLTAEVRDQNGRSMAGVAVTWSSADTSVATVDAAGLVEALGNGAIEIAAAAGEARGKATVTVRQSAASVVVAPPPPGAIAPGDTLRLAAEAFDANEHAVQGAEFTWSSSDAALATVDESGLVTGVTDGTATIAAAADAARGTVDVAVENPDRAALAAFFHATGGPRWADNGNWLSEVPLGEWHGVVTNRWGRVTELHLGRNDLAGSIPPEIGGLSRLRGLHLWHNRLTGEIPPEIGGLPDLEQLWLNWNDLSGSIPPEIGNLAGLQWLVLDQNKLLGPIPSGIGTLSQLRRLHLNNNRLTGPIPSEIGALPHLERLWLNWNDLSGPIPPEIGNLGNLQWLVLDANRLTGPIPPEIGGLSRLQRLHLNDNRLTGEIPPEIGRLSRLQRLHLNYNRLTALSPGVFGSRALQAAVLHGNPGSPFTLTVEMARTDSDDPMAPGPATLGFRIVEGAPFAMAIPLSVRGGTLSSAGGARFAAGTTDGGAVTVTPAGPGALSVDFGELPTVCTAAESETEGPICRGLEFVTGPSLVLSNPASIAVSVAGAYLVQSSQDMAGDVPLIAGRDALLRVFATADERYVVEDGGIATFFVDGREEHRIPLEAPVSGLIPLDVDEGRLGLSFNARIPGHVLQPGIELVVELDPGGMLPLAPGSGTRFPAAGRLALDVRELPPLDLTIVPVLWGTEPGLSTNAIVREVTRDMAGPDVGEVIHRVRGMLPIGDLNVRLREPPYITFAHTSSEPRRDLQLFYEIEMLRHLDGAESEYYHGIYYSLRGLEDWGSGGLGAAPGYVAQSGIWNDGHRIYGVMSHELGHNLSLWHARCAAAPGEHGYFPYHDGYIGVWGHAFPAGDETGFGRALDPAMYTDVMGEDDCSGWVPNGWSDVWTSDYSFVRALNHRLDLARTASLGTQRAPLRETLLLWGGVQGGSLRLEPAFAHRARVKLPIEPGPYRLEGLDAGGRRLFSLDFTPDELAHGGAGFLFAIPFQPEWNEDLDRLTLTGPEGSATVDRDAGGRAALIIDRATGRVRSIARDWTLGGNGLPASAEAREDVEVIRGLPTER